MHASHCAVAFAVIIVQQFISPCITAVSNPTFVDFYVIRCFLDMTFLMLNRLFCIVLSRSKSFLKTILLLLVHIQFLFSLFGKQFRQVRMRLIWGSLQIYYKSPIC